jgi:hypothetical protein
VDENPFRYFKASSEVTRLAVMMYVRYPLSLRLIEDLLYEHGIDISYEMVRVWLNWLRPRPKRSVSLHTEIERSGAGIWMKFSCGLMAKITIFGEPLTTKEKPLKSSPPRSGIARLR